MKAMQISRDMLKHIKKFGRKTTFRFEHLNTHTYYISMGCEEGKSFIWKVLFIFLYTVVEDYKWLWSVNNGVDIWES